MKVKRVKVFTSDKDPDHNEAGSDLTNMFNDWFEKEHAKNNTLEIISMHTNSNKYGWMLTIMYRYEE